MSSLPDIYWEMPLLPDISVAQITQLLFPVANHMAKICVKGINKPQTWQRQWAERASGLRREEAICNGISASERGELHIKALEASQGLCSEEFVHLGTHWGCAESRRKRRCSCADRTDLFTPGPSPPSPIREDTPGAAPFLSAIL